MSFQVPTHFVQQYSQNIMMLLQQKGGKLASYVTQASYTGKGAKATEQVGAVSPVKNLGRHSDTPLISTPADARWVFPNDYDWADLIDDQDKLRMLIDPLASYTQNGVNAMRRAQDEEILLAFFAAANTGENGTTSTAFPGGQQVGVNVGGTSSNLNVAKLRAARRLLMAAGVDLESEAIYCAITASDHDALLNEVQIASLDFNSQPVMVDGQVRRFLGINFIPVEFSDTTSYPQASAALVSGGVRSLPVWVPSGMQLGMWNDVQVSVDKRPDKRNSVQTYVTTTCGATRIEEKRVVQIATTG
jgi:hypothetical protein